MKIIGIVAEYNPFHNGHALQIAEARGRGGTHVAVCMSGNFTQRGEMAIFERLARAEMAISGGADLVLELPLRYCLSSAEGFAMGGVHILNQLGAHALSFGAEEADESKLKSIAGIISSEEFFEGQKEFLDEGHSFPKARAMALFNISPEYSEIISRPNNIIAIEYIKAIRKLGSEMSTMAIERKGALHDGKGGKGKFFSASHIRRMIESGDINIIKTAMPKTCGQIAEKLLASGEYHSPLRADIALLSRLRMFKGAEDLSFFDRREGLENRIYSAIESATTLAKLYESAKSKRIPEARIRRSIYQIALGLGGNIGKMPEFARVLALNERGAEILKTAKKNKDFLFSASLAQIKRAFKGRNDEIATEERANALYNLCLHSPRAAGEDYIKFS